MLWDYGALVKKTATNLATSPRLGKNRHAILRDLNHSLVLPTQNFAPQRLCVMYDHTIGFVI